MPPLLYWGNLRIYIIADRRYNLCCNLTERKSNWHGTITQCSRMSTAQIAVNKFASCLMLVRRRWQTDSRWTLWTYNSVNCARHCIVGEQEALPKIRRGISCNKQRHMKVPMQYCLFIMLIVYKNALILVK